MEFKACMVVFFALLGTAPVVLGKDVASESTNSEGVAGQSKKDQSTKPFADKIQDLMRQYRKKAEVSPRSLLLHLHEKSCGKPCQGRKDILDKIVNADPNADILHMHSDSMLDKYTIPTPPVLVHIRRNVPTIYHGDKFEDEPLRQWIDGTKTVFMKNFQDQDEIKTAVKESPSQDLCVIFYEGHCDDCEGNFAVVETAGFRLRHRLNVGRFNLTETPEFLKDMKKVFPSLPGIALFHQDDVFKYGNKFHKLGTLLSWLDGDYEKSKVVNVFGEKPEERTEL